MKIDIELLRWITRRDWIRLGLRKRLVKIWCKFQDTDIEFECNFFGYGYRGNLRDYIDRCVFFYGAYEKANLSLLKGLSTQFEDPIFVDIGANVGQHSLWMARFCSSVHSFEPWQPVREKLDEKVKLNNLKDVVHTYAVGLGDKEVCLPFYSPPESDTGIGSFIATHHDWNKDNGQELPIKVGDSFFAEKGIKPNIIKLDVEGFEKNVLNGIQKTLLKFKPVVLLEFSPTTKEQFSSYQDLLDIFPYSVEIQRVIVLAGWEYDLAPFDFDECSDILIQPI